MLLNGQLPVEILAVIVIDNIDAALLKLWTRHKPGYWITEKVIRVPYAT